MRGRVVVMVRVRVRVMVRVGLGEGGPLAVGEARKAQARMGVRVRACACVGVRAGASRQAGCALPPRGDKHARRHACRIGLRCRDADAEGWQGAGRCGAVFFRHARERWRRACFLWREAKRAKGRPPSRAASKWERKGHFRSAARTSTSSSDQSSPSAIVLRHSSMAFCSSCFAVRIWPCSMAAHA